MKRLPRWAWPTPSQGLAFYDTGTVLVTDEPVPGIESVTSAEALELCWG